MHAALPMSCALLLSACAVRPDERADAVTVESIRGPVGFAFDPDRRDWLVALRVVDAMTGAALTNAVVHRVYERNQPRGGEFFVDGTWHSNRYGFVRVPAAHGGSGWFVVEADGYGQIANLGALATVVQLMPGIDLPISVRDPFERAIPHCELGLCLGCGHTPDVRSATTDASGDALVRCVEPTGTVTSEPGIRDLYLRALGFSGVSQEVHWQLGDPTIVLRPDFVPAVRGRVIGPNGKPVAGVAIGGGMHRGPWTWSAEDGSFCLVGRESRGDELLVEVFGRKFELRVPATDRAIDVMLPAALPEPRAAGRLRVEVVDAVTGAAIEGADVEAWVPGLVHEADPHGSGETDASGSCLVNVAAGQVDVRVRVNASPSTHDPLHSTVVVTEHGEARLTVRLMPRTRRRVAIDGAWETLELVTETGSEDLTQDVLAGEEVPLPTRGPFALVLGSCGRCEQRFVYDSLPAESLSLHAFGETQVRLRVLDEHGLPVPARGAIKDRWWPPRTANLSWHDVAPDGGLLLPTDLTGSAFLYLEPLAAGVRPRVLHLGVPPRGDDIVLDLGDVVLRATDQPQLSIQDGSGAAARGVLRVLRPGLVVDRVELAADGGYDGPELEPGDRLEFSPFTGPAVSCTWTGQRSWRLPDERTALTIEVLDPFGMQPQGIVAVVGSRVQYGNQNTLTLAALPEGEVEIFVGGRGCDSARVTVRLARGEQRRLQVVLDHDSAAVHE